jgi:hypothetical protein
MEEEYMKISFTKVIDLVLNEERVKIRKFYYDTLGKATADIMDSYTPTDSQIMTLLTK